MNPSLTEISPLQDAVSHHGVKSEAGTTDLGLW